MEVEIPVLPAEPNFKVPMLPEDQEVVSKREGVHQRIQAEMYLEIKEAEEHLEASPG